MPDQHANKTLEKIKWTTEEHLERIVAKCRANLMLATQRTQGTNITRYDHGGGRVFYENGAGKRKLIADYYNEEDREYALACAGAAEAGWRSTIAAIEGLLAAEKQVSFDVHGYAAKREIIDALAAILAAWPEELL